MKSLLIKKKIKNSLAFDIVYRPQETDFLSYFVKEKRIYGISMLVNQALPCFEEWFGVKPIVDQELLNLLSAHTRQC